MLIKTSELEGSALDWAAAVAVNGSSEFFKAFGAVMLGRSIASAALAGRVRPSTDWSQGGPLVEAYRVEFYDQGNEYTAFVNNDSEKNCLECGCVIEGGVNGPTHLIAAMRAIVADKLGKSVQIPQELI